MRWTDAQGTMTPRGEETRTRLQAGLPYVIGKDYTRLVRLTRLWQRAMQKHRYGASLDMLVSQCESLYYRVYGSVCYYGDVPLTLRPSKYWNGGLA